MNRIPKSAELEKEFFASLIQETNSLSSLIRQGARLMLQKALEEEITYFLGRGHYQRHNNGPLLGYRNGYEPINLNLAEGKIELFLPQVRQTKQKFHSKILSSCRRRTDVLENFISLLYIKGLSVRDIEDILKNNLKLSKVSKSVVSNLSKSLEEDFNRWRNRDILGLDILYLFIDGIYLSLRQHSKEQEAVLVAYGITFAGNKVLLHLAQANKESYDACKAFICDMKECRLNEPLLVIFGGFLA